MSLNGGDWLFRGFLGEAWRAHVGADGVTVANTGDRVAAFVRLEEERAFGETPGVELHDDHLCLFPGERRRVGLTRLRPASRSRGLVASAWNAAAVTVRPAPEEA